MGDIIRASVVFAILASLTTPAYSQEKDKEQPKDFTNVKPEELGVKFVQAKKDVRTGFVVGGKNATSLVKGLTEISGRSIEALEKDMRPGANAEGGSTAGFLSPKERLLDVLAEDNGLVVDELGLTHQELARHLLVMAAIGSKLKNQEFVYHGRRFKVTGLDLTTGAQASPFSDGTTCGGQNPTVHNLDNGKKIHYSMLVPHMIERYGFYEGKETSFRVDPRQIIEVLDFIKGKKKD
jgi:hypothetical protein